MKQNFVLREKDGLALDVTNCKYVEGTRVNWAGSATGEDITMRREAGRDFIPDPRAQRGLPYMFICENCPQLVLGASTDLRLFSHLSSESSNMQVTVVTGLYSKVLNVSKNMTLKDLKNMIKEQMSPGEENSDFRIVLNQESKTN